MQKQFIYYRFPKDDDMPLRYYRNGDKLFSPQERGGFTVCILRTDGEIVSWGVAECSRKDAFCYAIGRKIAEGRAFAFLFQEKVDYKMGENSPFRHIFNTIKNDMLEVA